MINEATAPAAAPRSGWLSVALFGAICGINNLGSGLAIAALLFAGPLISGYDMGVGVIFVSSIIFAIIVSITSKLPNVVAEIQETSIAITATALSVAATNLLVNPEVMVATGLAILGGSTVFAGGLFYIVGYLRLGSLVRFIPYPVIAGSLAGSGWLLLEGGASMLTKDHGAVTLFFSLRNPQILALLIPAATFALLMVVMLRRVSHPILAPALMVTAITGFYLALRATGIGVEQARDWGWLPETHPGAAIVFPTPDMLLLVDWHQVTLAAPFAISAAVLNLFGVLLNTSGLELATGKELDLNEELQANGVANLLAGAIGGTTGFSALGHTLLAAQMGVQGRAAGFVTAAVVGLGLLFSQSLIADIPVFLTSGLVMFLGLQLLYEWGIDTRHRLLVTEWLIVLVILMVIATVGFLEGLTVGLLVCIVMFVYRYSQLPVIRFNASGAELRSTVDRSPSAIAFLNDNGTMIEALHLQGYLFFGTAEHIVDHVRQRMKKDDAAKLRFLVFDFRHVTGADSAAAACFTKVCNIAKLGNVHIIFSNTPPDIVRLIEQAGLAFSQDGPVSLVVDMDHALEFCETALLENLGERTDAEEVLSCLTSILGQHPNMSRLVDAMDRLQLEAGATLIRNGDQADDIFILVDGRVNVQIVLPNGDTMRLRTMTSGAVVGEAAFYLRQNRTADVVLEQDSIFYRLRACDLQRLELENGEVAALAHRLFATVLAMKLAQANRLIQVAHS